MVFDETDLKILTTFYNSAIDGDSNFTSWKLMRKIYPSGGDTDHTMVRRKLMKFVEMGIMTYSKEEGFILIQDYIKIDEIPTIKKCISLKVDGKWEIFES